MTMRSELVDLDVVIKAETELAIGVENLKGRMVWLPKSQIEIERGKGRNATVTMPE
jgi:hypothetical protein